MRVFPSSMATSSTSGWAASHAQIAILYPRRSDAAMNTSIAIETLPSFSAARPAFPAVAWFGSVDAEGLPEAPPSQWGDDYGVAALHPFQPAEIEIASGDRGRQRTRDVWASL